MSDKEPTQDKIDKIRTLIHNPIYAIDRSPNAPEYILDAAYRTQIERTEQLRLIAYQLRGQVAALRECVNIGLRSGEYDRFKEAAKKIFASIAQAVIDHEREIRKPLEIKIAELEAEKDALAVRFDAGLGKLRGALEETRDALIDNNWMDIARRHAVVKALNALAATAPPSVPETEEAICSCIEGAVFHDCDVHGDRAREKKAGERNETGKGGERL